MTDRVHRRGAAVSVLLWLAFATPGCSGVDGPTRDAARSVSPARPTATIRPSDDRLLRIRDGVLARIDAGDVPSMAVAVIHRGRLVWNEGLGLADRKTARPATPETAYLVGSMSKSIMATGVLTLVERDLVGLDDPVAPLLEPRGLRIVERESDGEVVTLRDLLDMRAGIPHGWMTLPPDADPAGLDTRRRHFTLMAESVFPPGDVYHYSNFSASLPAEVVEAASGQGFAEYMRRHLFAPLGMTGAGVSVLDVDTAALATAYDAEGEPIPGPGYQVAAGGAGFVASAADLVQYARFHLGELGALEPPVLGEELLERQHAFGAGPDSLFGLGWFLGDQLVSNGRVAGGSSWLSLVPADRLAVICLTNTTSSAADEVCREIVRALAPSVAAAGAGAYERYVAKYENPYEPRPELAGRWVGTTRIGDRTLAIVLELPAEGGAVLRIGSGGPLTLDGIRFDTRGVFRARATESVVLPTPLSDGAIEVSVGLVLRLDGRRLYGYVSETFGYEGGGYRLGSYVSLRRTEGG